MNPQGGEANGNNQNEEGLLEGFPEAEENLLQQGSNNNRLSTVPLHETPNLQLELNLPPQGDNIDDAVTGFPVAQDLNFPPPDYNMSFSSFHVGSSSNTLNIPRKRTFSGSGQFCPGESSNMGQQQAGEAKRAATESEVGANNNVRPLNAGTPVPPHNAGTPVPPPNAGTPVPPPNAGTPVPPPNPGANRNQNTDTGRSASHAPPPSQASFFFSGTSAHTVQHPRPLQRYHSGRPVSIMGGPFMTSATSIVSNIFMSSTPPIDCPHPRVDIIIPFYEHVSFSTWVSPQGTPGMNHSAAASSSGTQNHHGPQQTSASAFPPSILSSETRSRLPSEVRSILDSLSNNGHGLIFEVENPELSTGLALETIMRHMERETFLEVAGDGPEEHEQKCTICLEEFETGSEIGKLHLCDHKFHFECIKEWLLQKNLCPVCRRVALERHLNNPNGEFGYFFL